MNETKALILIKKEDQWIDITKEFRNSEKLDNNKIQINYYNYPNQIISQDDFIYDYFIEERDTSDINIIFKNNWFINFTKLYIYRKYIKIRFTNGKYNFYDKKYIIISSKNQKLVIDSYIKYLIKISKYIDEHPQEKRIDDLPSGHLTQQIRLLGNFRDSILYNILSRDQNFKLENGINNLIFPFSYNQSQCDAIQKALNNNISIIEGPPGTGKTQTILNIIANLIINNKTIAVISSNNEATKNIKDKLTKHGLDWITAFIGNSSNIKAFFNSIPSIPEDAYKWKLDNNSIYNAKNKIKKLVNMNYKNLQNEIEFAKLKMQISELEIEAKNFLKSFSINMQEIPLKLKNKKLSINEIWNIKLLIQAENLSKKIITMFYKYRIKKKYRFDVNSADDIKLFNIINFLDSKYYELKLAELNKKCDFINKKIKSFDANKCQLEINNLSMKLLKNKIYESHLIDRSFTQLDYRNNFQKFITAFPVIFSTTNSLKNTISPGFKFDYIIMDESSQIDLISSTIALSCAKNLVLVGDLQQISNVVSSNHIKGLNQIFNDSKDLSINKNYVNNSLLRSILNEFDSNKLPKTFLNEHYRCDPLIINFCNKQFYENKLIIRTEHKQNNGIKIILANPYGERENVNEREIYTIQKEVIDIYNLGNCDVGIISPFRKQVNKMQELLHNDLFEIDTIHKFQGREKDIIILTTVKSKVNSSDSENDFINQPNLLNVTVSRAKNQLYVVASEKLLNQSKSIYSNLLKYVEYYCGGNNITKQQTYSLMDLLHKEYSAKLNGFLKTMINISSFVSENIVGSLLVEITNEGKFGLLQWLHDYNLNRIIPIQQIYQNGVFQIKDGYEFNLDDLKFVRNCWTHCDFVIFEKFGKKAICVIEVDGKQHVKDKDQIKRDAIKDNLLKIFGIPILRVSTDDVILKEKIEDFLSKNVFNVDH